MIPSIAKHTQTIRIVVISDTHGLIQKINIPNGDVFIDCGDITMLGSKKHMLEYHQVLKALPHKYKIVIAGNHDVCLDKFRREALMSYYPAQLRNFSCEEAFRLLSNCIYLQSSGVRLFGYNIYGTPYTQKSSKYAFALPKDEIIKEWNKIPSNTDILITHCPPLSIRDLTVYRMHIGSESLRDTVLNRVKPKYHFFGHVHEQYGMEEVGGVKFYNCSVTNIFRRRVNEAVVVDVPNLDYINYVGYFCF